MFWSILVFLLVLSVLVLVHEFGHYWVAKRNGVWVEEFGFGLPPRVFGKKIGETIYSINALPFGGFVRLHGEMNEDPTPQELRGAGGVFKASRAFINKSLWVKTAVIVAGVIMNFLLAIVCFAIVYSFSGIPREQGYVEIVDIVADSPASNSNIVVGQKLYSIDNKDVVYREEVTDISSKGGKHTLIIGDKDADRQDLKKVVINTKFDEEDQKWYMGLVLTSTEIFYPPYWQRPFYGAYYGTKEAMFWGKNVVNGFISIFADLFKGQSPKDVSGPVGVFAVTTEVAKTGVLSLINLVGIISVNLAILNIIPFPALDGGRLLFIIVEAIFGKKVAPKLEGIIHSVGMIILLLAILTITVKDIRGLISAGSISGFLNNMAK